MWLSLSEVFVLSAPIQKCIASSAPLSEQQIADWPKSYTNILEP